MAREDRPNILKKEKPEKIPYFSIVTLPNIQNAILFKILKCFNSQGKCYMMGILYRERKSQALLKIAEALEAI
jgi:hypothetical protein